MKDSKQLKASVQKQYDLTDGGLTCCLGGQTVDLVDEKDRFLMLLQSTYNLMNDLSA